MKLPVYGLSFGPAAPAAEAYSAAGNSARSATVDGGVLPSGPIECQICHAGCMLIPDPILQAACHITCDLTVC